MALGTYATPAAFCARGSARRTRSPATASRWPHELAGVGRGMQDHPKISYRFWIGTDAPPWPSPWNQALLTGAPTSAASARVSR